MCRPAPSLFFLFLGATLASLGFSNLPLGWRSFASPGKGGRFN